MTRAPQGYVYVPLADGGAFTTAGPGALARNPSRGPPWIVVNHTLERVIVARWPGRLWRVVVEEPASAASQIAGAGYTRAVAVRILEEMQAWRLFGDNGAAIVPLIDAARGLTRAAAETLAAARDPGAAEACTRVWNAWLARKGADRRPADLDGVLRLAGLAASSPVGDALSVIHRQVFDQACRVDGDAATRTEPGDADGDFVWLVDPWLRAQLALLDAALALGAPADVSGADVQVLLRAWRALE